MNIKNNIKNKNDGQNTDSDFFVCGVTRVGNTFKINWADKYVAINQHRKALKPSNARKLSRQINKGKIVIN